MVVGWARDKAVSESGLLLGSCRFISVKRYREGSGLQSYSKLLFVRFLFSASRHFLSCVFCCVALVRVSNITCLCDQVCSEIVPRERCSLKGACTGNRFGPFKDIKNRLQKGLKNERQGTRRGDLSAVMPGEQNKAGTRLAPAASRCPKVSEWAERKSLKSEQKRRQSCTEYRSVRV